MPQGLSRQLRVALIQQADLWQSLITCQQTLNEITKETITQEILSNFIGNVRQNIETDAKKELSALSPMIFILGGFIAIFLFLIVLFVVLSQDKTLASNPLIGGGLSGILSILSFFGLGSLVKNWNIFSNPATTSTTSTTTTTSTSHPSNTPSATGTPPASGTTSTTTTSSTVGNSSAAGAASSTNNQPSSQNTPPDVLTRFEDIVRANASTILNIYQKVNAIVEDELQELDSRASVASPLIEFFILNSSKDDQTKDGKAQQQTNQRTQAYDFSINSSYEFLTNVIWTHEEREKEINRLLHAVLDPIGANISGQLTAAASGANKTSTQGGGTSQGSSSGQTSGG